MSQRLPRRLNTALVIDLIVVVCFIPAAIGLSLYAHADLAVFVLLYYAPPTLYLCWRKKKNYRKILFASLVLGVLLGMAYDIIAEFHSAYFTTYRFIPLSYLFAGRTSIGDILWAFLIPLYTITFYEHFLDDEKITAISKRGRVAFFVGLILLCAAWLLVHLFPDFPRLPYAYAILGFMTAVPLFGLVMMRRRAVWKLACLTGFFFVFNVLGETAELYLKLGGYNGQYIGWVPLLVARMPIEELIYWTLLSAPAFIFCYEWLFDDFR